MNRKHYYRDLNLWRETTRKQKQRYYQKTATFTKIPWTAEQDAVVLRHDIPDSQLSQQIGHSLAAIQIRRSRLKKKAALADMQTKEKLNDG